jgi:lysozyme
MNVSNEQLQRTAAHEGFVATAYKDGSASGVQKYSIGYGHQIQANESSLYTESITKEKGLSLLNGDMQNVVRYVNQNSKKSLNQGQADSLFDFGFNCGVGALGNVITVLNEQGYGAVPAKMALYNKWQPTPGKYEVNPDLVLRRQENIDVWNGVFKKKVHS